MTYSRSNAPPGEQVNPEYLKEELDAIALAISSVQEASKGDKGDAGREIELRTNQTHIQWRYSGGLWVNLIALSSLRPSFESGTATVVSATGSGYNLAIDVVFQRTYTTIPKVFTTQTNNWLNVINLTTTGFRAISRSSIGNNHDYYSRTFSWLAIP